MYALEVNDRQEEKLNIQGKPISGDYPLHIGFCHLGVELSKIQRHMRSPN